MRTSTANSENVLRWILTNKSQEDLLQRPEVRTDVYNEEFAHTAYNCEWGPVVKALLKMRNQIQDLEEDIEEITRGWRL